MKKTSTFALKYEEIFSPTQYFIHSLNIYLSSDYHKIFTWSRYDPHSWKNSIRTQTLLLY